MLAAGVADGGQGRSEPAQVAALGIVAIARPERAGRVDRALRVRNCGFDAPARRGRRGRELGPRHPELIAEAIEQARDIRVVPRPDRDRQRADHDPSRVGRLDPDRPSCRMEADLDRPVRRPPARHVADQGVPDCPRQPGVDVAEERCRSRDATRGAAPPGLADGPDRDGQRVSAPAGWLRRYPLAAAAERCPATADRPAARGTRTFAILPP